jgi:hypothetical protein
VCVAIGDFDALEFDVGTHGEFAAAFDHMPAAAYGAKGFEAELAEEVATRGCRKQPQKLP